MTYTKAEATILLAGVLKSNEKKWEPLAAGKFKGMVELGCAVCKAQDKYEDLQEKANEEIAQKESESAKTESKFAVKAEVEFLEGSSILQGVVLSVKDDDGAISYEIETEDGIFDGIDEENIKAG